MSVAMALEPDSSPLSPTGRLRHQGLTCGDRNYALWIHLSPLLAFLVIGPLALILPIVMWAVRKDESPFADDHGREVVNFLISFVILHFVLLITVIGIPILWIVGIVSIVRGAVAASHGEYFRYPMTFRFV